MRELFHNTGVSQLSLVSCEVDMRENWNGEVGDREKIISQAVNFGKAYLYRKYPFPHPLPQNFFKFPRDR